MIERSVFVIVAVFERLRQPFVYNLINVTIHMCNGEMLPKNNMTFRISSMLEEQLPPNIYFLQLQKHPAQLSGGYQKHWISVLLKWRNY